MDTTLDNDSATSRTGFGSVCVCVCVSVCVCSACLYCCMYVHLHMSPMYVKVCVLSAHACLQLCASLSPPCNDANRSTRAPHSTSLSPPCNDANRSTRAVLHIHLLGFLANGRQSTNNRELSSPARCL